MAERTFGSYPQVTGMQGGGDKEDEIKMQVEEILRWDRLRGKKICMSNDFLQLILYFWHV